MAIYHLSAKVISRAEGRSSVGAAAYRSGSTLRNERDGQVHDYSRKRFVEHAEILAPENAPDWMRDRAQLWNAVEVAEKRKDAQLAREIEVALPRELAPHEQRELIRSFARAEFVEKGMVADIAIHNPRASDGQDQPHAHVMLTMRALTGEGFGAKNRDWNGKDQLGEWRAAWEEHANRVLERHGHESRIDHRTLDAQREAARERGDESRADALDREPQPKLGIAAAGMERRGVPSERGEGWREADARNDERRSIRDQLREIGERIAELGGQIRDGMRSAAGFLRDRLSRAAATVMERSRTPDAERGDRHEPGSAADRIAERLRAAEAGRNRGRGPGREDGSGAGNPADGRAREGPPERGQERQGGAQSAEDRIAERLLQRFHDDQDQVRERERTREQELDRPRSKDRDYER